jgi:hypothetical protein
MASAFEPWAYLEGGGAGIQDIRQMSSSSNFVKSALFSKWEVCFVFADIFFSIMFSWSGDQQSNCSHGILRV